jgi:hypothetical protein
MSLKNGAVALAGSPVGEDTRDRLVGALSTVSVLLASRSAPDVGTPGAAWPRWVQTTYAGKLCTTREDTYDVLVVVPGADNSTSVDDGDATRELVAPVLMSTVGVELAYAEPVAVAFNDRQTMPAVRFRVTVRR